MKYLQNMTNIERVSAIKLISEAIRVEVANAGGSLSVDLALHGAAKRTGCWLSNCRIGLTNAIHSGSVKLVDSGSTLTTKV